MGSKNRIIEPEPLPLDPIVAWAEGHALSDPQFAMSNRTDVHTVLTLRSLGSVAFWRGFFEGIASVSIVQKSVQEYPLIRMRACPQALWALMEWAYETNPRFDRTSTSIRDAVSGRIILTGVKAQDMMSTLYPKNRLGLYGFGMPGFMAMAKQIEGWAPRSTMKYQEKLVDGLISRALINGLTRVGQRIEYAQFRPF